MSAAKLERRVLPARFELRAGGAGKPKTLRGYASVFNSDSEDLGGFTEQIAPGAFTECLKNCDCRMLFNHDSNMVLGRTPDSLSLRQDATGLYFECTPPSTSYADDVMELISKGMVDQCSFGFTVAADAWYDSTGKPAASWTGTRRFITKIGSLYDTSVVTFPAYNATSVSARSKFLFPEGRDGATADVRTEAQRTIARARFGIEQGKRAVAKDKSDGLAEVARLRKLYF